MSETVAAMEHELRRRSIARDSNERWIELRKKLDALYERRNNAKSAQEREKVVEEITPVEQELEQVSRDAAIATDPPVSEAQRKAMYAAREGRSTLGIPKKVGEEFVGKAHDEKPVGRWGGRARDT